MTLQWWQRGEQKELRSHDGAILWASINRVAPFYRVRLYHGPASQLKKAGSLRAAKAIALDWHEQRTQ
jgi:hypothetical protein